MPSPSPILAAETWGATKDAEALAAEEAADASVEASGKVGDVFAETARGECKLDGTPGRNALEKMKAWGVTAENIWETARLSRGGNLLPADAGRNGRGPSARR